MSRFILHVLSFSMNSLDYLGLPEKVGGKKKQNFTPKRNAAIDNVL